ncbi:MAG: FAD-dependent oxidoreductase, partial [bacterium]
MKQFQAKRMVWLLVLALCVTMTATGCLRQAPGETPEEGAETREADVIVVGGGGAGLAAATAAAEKGASVILLEKAAFLGGNTILAGGAYNAVNP